MRTLQILLLLSTILLANDMLYTGYVPTYRMNHIDDYDYENLTHVFAAFGNPDSTGSMSINMDIGTFVEKVTANGKTKALLSIGGGGDYSWGPDTTIYAHLFADTNRTMFVDSIVTYLLRHNLHGVDADIEGTPLGHHNYDLFLNELADSIEANNLLLTAALGATSWGGASHLDDSTLQRFDFIMTMSYGGTWSSTDLATFDKMVSDLKYFTARGVPAEKVVGGIPYYAVTYNPKGYLTLSQLYSTDQYLDQEPFYNDTIKTSDGGDIYLNSWPTIKKKIDFTVDSGYGGIMIWELGQDNYSGTGYSMSDTIASYLNPSSTQTTFSQTNAQPQSLYQNSSTVTVYDLRGRVVAEFDKMAQQPVQYLKELLPQGIYVVQYHGVHTQLGAEKLHIR